jgi:hypothetical protein
VTTTSRWSSVGARLACLASTLGVCAGLAWLTAAALSPSLVVPSEAFAAFCAAPADSPDNHQLAGGESDLKAPPAGNQASSDGLDDDDDDPDDSLAVEESVRPVSRECHTPRLVARTEVLHASFVPSCQSLRAPPSIALF